MKKQTIIALLAVLMTTVFQLPSVFATEIDENTSLSFFHIATENNKPPMKMIDGIMDAFTDESGIDKINSSNYKYLPMIDQSHISHLIQINGDVSIDNENKKVGKSSLHFDGDGDYLSVPSDSSLNIIEDTDSDYTIDFWVKMNDIEEYQFFLSSFEEVNDKYWALYYSKNSSSSEGLAFWSRHGTLQTMYTDDVILEENVWYHIALVKKGNILGLYLDGDQVNYTTISGSGSVDAPLTIGKQSRYAIGTEDFYLNGNIDELRIHKYNYFGADPQSNNSDIIDISILELQELPQSLVLTGEGVDQATEIIDEAGNVTNEFGDVQIDTSNAEIGSGSILFDGNGDYLEIPTDQKFNILSDTDSDYTIDFWFRLNQISSYQFLVSSFEETTDKYWCIYYSTNSGEGLAFWSRHGTNQNMYTNRTLSTNQWYHLAVVRKGSTLGIYLDGLLINSTTVNGVGRINAPLSIGRQSRYSYGTEDFFFNGRIDELRISNFNLFNADPTNSSDTIYSYETHPLKLYLPSDEIDHAYQPVTSSNMILISNETTAESTPSSGKIVIFEEDIDLITENTDLKAYIGKGTTWNEVTLFDFGDYEDDKRMLVGSCTSLSGIGDDIQYKIQTFNEKDLKIHGVGLSWE